MIRREEEKISMWISILLVWEVVWGEGEDVFW